MSDSSDRTATAKPVTMLNRAADAANGQPDGTAPAVAQLPTARGVPFVPGEFATLNDALDYAATAETGLTFHDRRGRVEHQLPYAVLRNNAQRLARALLALNFERGARIALTAETTPAFVTLFFACSYAALTPVPLPAAANLGARDAHGELIGRLLKGAQANALITSDPGLADAAQRANIAWFGDIEQLMRQPVAAQGAADLPATRPHDLAYIQFTSGSTRTPTGAVMTHRAVMANIEAMIKHGLELTPTDRFCSWLPLYHDMGLVGKLLTPMASQSSVDLFDSRSFAMRPSLWPALIDRYRATISYAPPFGYDLCARRQRRAWERSTQNADGWDLSCWRIAGVGADMIRPSVLEDFSTAFATANFNSRAFMPSYGMAEVGLGITFAPVASRYIVDTMSATELNKQEVTNPGNRPAPRHTAKHRRRFVDCGIPLPGTKVEIRDRAGNLLGDREPGSIFVRSPSLMSGYHQAPTSTAAAFDARGWLDTGDLGYWRNGHLVLTGRRKDMIIVHGRNIWPQDLEFLAEQRNGVRAGGAAAFAVADERRADTSDATDNPADLVVMLVECRLTEPLAQVALTSSLSAAIRAEFGIDVIVKSVLPRSLPRTSSGKLSRSRARLQYLDSVSPDLLHVSPRTRQPRSSA